MVCNNVFIVKSFVNDFFVDQQQQKLRKKKNFAKQTILPKGSYMLLFLLNVWQLMMMAIMMPR